MAYSLLICLILDIRWVPLENYGGSDTVISDTDGNHVGRINTEYGYIIGKIDDETGHFYAAYRQELFTDRATHQYEVDRSSIPPIILHTSYR